MVYPPEFKTGELIYPFEKAERSEIADTGECSRQSADTEAEVVAPARSACIVSTVSRALNPDSPPSRSLPTLSKKIRKASERLEYRPNAAAYSLQDLASRTIGVVVPDIADPVFPPIIRGIEDGLAEHGYVAILANTDGDARRQQRIVETMRARGVDGLILATVCARRAGAVAACAGMPVVTVSAREPTTRASHRWCMTRKTGYGRILTHLVSLGHRAHRGDRRPAGASRPAIGRYRSFTLHRKLLGIGKAKPNAVVRQAPSTKPKASAAPRNCCARGQPFTAIVCANDRLAVGAIAALRRHGLDVRTMFP